MNSTDLAIIIFLITAILGDLLLTALFYNAISMYIDEMIDEIKKDREWKR